MASTVMWKHENSCHLHTLCKKQSVNFGASFLNIQTVISIKSGNMCSLFLNKCHEFHCCFQRSELVAKVNARSSKVKARSFSVADSAASRDCVVPFALAIRRRKLDFPAKIKINTFLKYSGKHSFSN